MKAHGGLHAMEKDTLAELAAECAAGSPVEQLMQDLPCQSFLHKKSQIHS